MYVNALVDFMLQALIDVELKFRCEFKVHILACTLTMSVGAEEALIVSKDSANRWLGESMFICTAVFTLLPLKQWQKAGQLECYPVRRF